MSKLYTETPIIELSYIEAYKLMKKGFFLTRPQWDGFHFVVNRQYYIMQKDKTILANPKEVYGEAERDWMVVDPTNSIMEILKQINLVTED